MIKKLTIKERQKIYKHLSGVKCPDLLAALIAKRAQLDTLEILRDETTLQEFIPAAFRWSETPEGFEFWQMMQECALEIECKGLHWGEHPSDYDLPVDLEHKLAQDIKVAIENPLDESSELTWWNKVKLFFGKWVYKV
jgi:hypothetical protein